MCALFLSGDARAVQEEGRLWAVAGARMPLTARLSASLLVQGRFVDDLSEFERVLVRPSAAFTVVPWLEAALGYDAHVVEYPVDRVEHRIWQQASLRRDVARLGIDLRLRLEQRFLEDVDGTAVRGRARLRLTHPIPRTRWHVAASNEVYVGFNSLTNGPRRGFDEDRLFAGIGRPLGGSVRAELGYQLQYVDRIGPDAAYHTLFVALSFAPR